MTQTVTITLAVADALELFDVVANTVFKTETDLVEARAIGDKAEVRWLTDAFAIHNRLYDVLHATVGQGTPHWPSEAGQADETDEYEDDDLTADEAVEEAHTVFYDGLCEQCSAGLVRAVRCRVS